MKIIRACALCLALSPSGLHAQEILISCEFELSKTPSSDADAQSWLKDYAFRRRNFVFQIEPPKITDGPGWETGPDGLWSEARITVTKQELSFEWNFRAKPLTRTPAINLRINRFSGKAFETYSMLHAPNQGPLEVHWARYGQCEFNKKKI